MRLEIRGSQDPEEQVIEIWLEKDTDGTVYLVVGERDSKINYIIESISFKNGIRLHNSVSSNLGFPLDEKFRVRVCKD